MHDSPPPYPGIVPNSTFFWPEFYSIHFKISANFLTIISLIDPPPNYGGYGQQQPDYQPQGYPQPGGGYPGYPQSGGYGQPNGNYPPQGYPQSNPYPSSGGYPAQPSNVYPQVPNAAPYGNPAPSCEFCFSLFAHSGFHYFFHMDGIKRQKQNNA